MTPEDLLKGIKKDIRPRASVQKNIRASLTARMQSDSPLFAELKKSVTPTKSAKSAIWNRIVPFVELPQIFTFTRLRGAINPTERFKVDVKQQVLQRITEPIEAAFSRSQPLKWASAFVLFGLLVRMSPMLFIASPTVAESQYVLMPTYGEVSVLIEGIWQNVGRDMPLRSGSTIRTHDGGATLAFGNFGVIRMDKMTTLKVNDLSGRLEPASEMLPVATLFTGRAWAWSLIPEGLRSFTIATSAGHIAVNGSVSIAEDDYVDVEVYDRSAVVHKNGEKTYLTAGERTRLFEESNVLLVKKIPAKWNQYAWQTENRNRDLVHRSQTVQKQHEYRVAQAGILPTSPLYPAKRIAEYINELLVFSKESNLRMKLDNAETRLNEAAALIDNGDDAALVLQEYKQSLNDIANGEGSSLVEFLVQRALVQSQSMLSAALPGDESYVIKQTVLETSASIDSPAVAGDHAQGALLLDGLAVMLRAADEGRTDMVRTIWSDLHPNLVAVEDDTIAMSPSMYKEAKTLLAFLASTLHTASNRGVEIDPELLDDLALYLPPPTEPDAIVLSEAEIMEIVDGIKQKIFVYDMTQSRINQFMVEIRALAMHPDQGRILRRLALSLPEGPENFPDRIFKEIVRLRWDRAAGEVL